MRPIKFRAWMKEKQIMVPDYASQIYNGQLAVSRWPDDAPNLILMQFTGLLDKNGKEIYEGDILRIEETAISQNDAQKILRGADVVQSVFVGKVEWDSESLDYNLVDSEREIIIGFPRHEQTHEVLGNAWEKPELLKRVLPNRIKRSGN